MVLVTMCELDGDVSRAVLLRPQVELQIPRLPPDFLSCLVVSVDFMRLSSKKAAYVVVDESSVVGNPEFARDDKGEGSGAPWTELINSNQPGFVCPLGTI